MFTTFGSVVFYRICFWSTGSCRETPPCCFFISVKTMTAPAVWQSCLRVVQCFVCCVATFRVEGLRGQRGLRGRLSTSLTKLHNTLFGAIDKTPPLPPIPLKPLPQIKMQRSAKKMRMGYTKRISHSHFFLLAAADVCLIIENFIWRRTQIASHVSP